MADLPQENGRVVLFRANRRANITLIASLSLQGMGEALILDGSADTTAFEISIEQILAPSRASGTNRDPG